MIKRIIFYSLLAFVLMVSYTNCGSSLSGPVQIITSENSSSGTLSSDAQLACNDSALQAVYQNSYYSFLKSHTCNTCHSGGGEGPPLASADIGTAYSTFKTGPGTFRDRALASNAVNPNHHGGGSPANEPQVSAAASIWAQGISSNCTVQSGGATDASSWSKAFVSKSLSAKLAAGASTTLTWTLSTDLTPQTNFDEVQLSVVVKAAAAGQQDGYFISKPLLTSKTKGVLLKGLRILLNGRVYEAGTTFLLASGDLPAQVPNYPIDTGTMFIPATRYDADTLAVQIQTLSTPSNAQNGVIPGSGKVTYSAVPLFSELIAPGGALAANCAVCHNAVLKADGLNVLDIESVKAYSVAGTNASKSALYRSLSNANNPMPPKASLSNADKAAILSWMQNGMLP